jgi:hypothetical protein
MSSAFCCLISPNASQARNTSGHHGRPVDIGALHDTLGAEAVITDLEFFAPAGDVLAEVGHGPVHLAGFHE